ncbi:MAG: hypothetical protein IT325_13150 [Anaerolineae bacterium]|nr:hypothetical protein [Anaerolineae bacterium]
MTVKSARILWIVAVVALGLTTAMNLFGGIGTVCAAFLTENFPPMLVLLDHQWLYQRMMLITIGIGIAGASATFALFRGGSNAYRNALLVLIAGVVMGELHTRASLELRGKMVPANVKFYLNLFTLILFLILGLPSLRNRVSFASPRGRIEATAAGGLAALIVGATMLTIPLWVGDTHTYEGTDWTNVLQPGLSIVALAFMAGGLGVFVKAVLEVVRRPDLSSAHQPVVSS